VPVNSPDGYSILAAGPAAYFPGLFGDTRIPITSATATASTVAGLGSGNNLTSRLVNYTCACTIPALYGDRGYPGDYGPGDVAEGAHIVIKGYTGTNNTGFNADAFNNGSNTTLTFGALYQYFDATQVLQVYANSNVTNGSSPAVNTGYAFFPITPVSAVTAGLGGSVTVVVPTTVGMGGFPASNSGTDVRGIYGQMLGFQPLGWNNSLVYLKGEGKRAAVAVPTPSSSWTSLDTPTVYGTIQVGGYGAQFDVYVMSNSTNSGNTLSYFVQLLNAGNFYSSNMQIVLLGTNLGGTTPTNDLTITVTAVNAGTNYSITTFTFTGTPAATSVSISNGLTAYIYSNISPSTVPYIQSNANYSITGVVPTGYNISNTAVLYTTSAATKFFSPYNLSNGLSNATVNGYGSSASGGTSTFSNTGLFVISNLGGYNGKVFSTVGKVVRSVPLSVYSALANVTYTAAGGGVNNNSYTLYALQSNVSNSYQKIVVAVNGNVTTPTGDVSASYTNPWFVSNSPIGTLIQPTVTMSGPDTIVIDSSSGFLYMLDTTSNIYRATTNVTVSNTTYNGIVYPGTTIGGATMTSAFGIPSTLFVSTAIGGANVLYSIYSYPITSTHIAGMYVFSVTPGY
jgi:hypothetical protein